MHTTEQKLIEELLRGYNKDAHPVPLRQNKSYKVTFGLELVQLVDVVSEEATGFGLIRQSDLIRGRVAALGSLFSGRLPVGSSSIV